MRLVSTAAAWVGLSIIVGGCGASNDVPASSTSSVGKKADVMVTLDGVHHICMVALAKEEQGSSIACSDIVPFIRDELRLPSGATYEIRTTAQASDAESAALGASLKGAGYRHIGDL